MILGLQIIALVGVGLGFLALETWMRETDRRLARLEAGLQVLRIATLEALEAIAAEAKGRGGHAA